MTHTLPAALYHHTDTARIPWILSSGALAPCDNRIGGMPADVLWATTNPVGDRTTSQDRGGDWRAGNTWHARFVLDPTDFEPWSTARGTVGFPAHLIDRLERAPGADPATWWIRRDPLPIADAVIEVRSYSNNSWRRAEISEPFRAGPPNGLGVMIGGQFFGSVQEPGVAGGKAYRTLVMGAAA